jgi:hypothetical protein
VAYDVRRRLTVDDKTLRFLRVMREQMRGKNSREVYSGDAAQELGMAPGSPEYEARLADLVRAEYLQPHPNPTQAAHGACLITDRGIGAADMR